MIRLKQVLVLGTILFLSSMLTYVLEFYSMAGAILFLVGASIGALTIVGLLYQWQIQRSNRSTQQLLSYYLPQLKQTSQPDKRQQLLDTMVALDLLNSCDFTGIDISEANLHNAKLTNVNMSISKQVGVDLRGADLRKANVSYSNLSYSLLRSINFKSANLHGSTFDHSDLHQANLQGANLSASSLQDVDLSDANLSNANLRFANLKNANLVGANFTNADLTHCILPDGNEGSLQTNMLTFTDVRNTPQDNLMSFAQFVSKRTQDSNSQ